MVFFGGHIDRGLIFGGGYLAKTLRLAEPMRELQNSW